MKNIQLLAIETGAECNLAAIHKKCPAAIRQHSGTPLTDEKRIALVVEAYMDHGFGGLVGWHYYNEPTLQLGRILYMMTRIRAAVPESRFILWSNGTMPCDDPRMGLFEQAQITNYYCNETMLREKFASVKTVKVFDARFDDRLSAPFTTPSRRPCLRPFVEIPVDNFGMVHLCCQDWPGEIKIGNAWTDSWEQILAKRLEIVEKICGKEMSGDAPERCKSCSGRLMNLPAFDAAARAAAHSWVAGRESLCRVTDDGAMTPEGTCC